MPVGRPRDPTALIELKGGLKTNPGRYADRVFEPKKGLPLDKTPPKGLSKAEVEWWNSLLETCWPGTIFQHDRYALAEFAKVLAALNSGSSKIPPGTHTRFFRFVTMFGLSPADRSRIQVDNKADSDENPFSEFN